MTTKKLIINAHKMFYLIIYSNLLSFYGQEFVLRSFFQKQFMKIQYSKFGIWKKSETSNSNFCNIFDFATTRTSDDIENNTI